MIPFKIAPPRLNNRAPKVLTDAEDSNGAEVFAC